jgi:hypothetical protein
LVGYLCDIFYGDLCSAILFRCRIFCCSGGATAHASEVLAKARAAAIKYLEGKIFADASLPATLNNGGRATHCSTLQEAVLAWMRLPERERDAATIHADDGTVYDADKIERLYHSEGPDA